ncbi:LysR family transcriptional regulator [Rhodovulum sp. BSW8]|uniref:Putative oxidoreductase n=1 Tax=Rhodovulum visakhapatnamense TaxID=364297 RepID=A0A4R8G2F3_9RHOB|nr:MULTISPECIES: DoxX family protein [Rhodovulum]RBO54810.1 LysR family transcriptional regulator [Rhodovulum sp. BSW8]TDX33610.1 putative oxidoreductase [Rhodovulum visakhapatnamense]
MTTLLQDLGFGSATAIDVAALLLRVALGALFLAHAWLKIFVFRPAGAAGFFRSLGLPGVLAYLTMAAEILGGLALIVGLWTSLVSILLIPVIAGAGWFAHRANGFWFNNQNGGWEYPAFWTLTLLVQALLGSGALALTAI